MSFIALIASILIGASCIGWLLNAKKERIDGIITTKWKSYRSMTINYTVKDDVLEKVYCKELPYPGFSIAGQIFEKAKKDILDEDETVQASFGGALVKSPNGYFLVTDAQGTPLASIILVTNKRILLWSQNAEDGKIMSFRYQDITRIGIERGIMFSTVTINTPHTSIVIDNLGDTNGLFSYMVRKQLLPQSALA